MSSPLTGEAEGSMDPETVLTTTDNPGSHGRNDVATKKLMLVDGHALVHRAFHALPELTTTSGELVNAVFGWTSMVIKAMDTLHPTHVIVAFDRPSPTFRHEQYADYKATRPRTPRPLALQFDRVREVAAAFNMPIVELSGYEADDILGTLAHQAERMTVPTVIVTGDLDTLQLVDDYITVLTNGRQFSDTKLYTRESVVERYGLTPEQIPDLKGLIGDTSDNIPGIRGIGEKTAAKLLIQYGSLDEIFEHIGEISGKVGELLRDARDQSFRSRDLARIVTAPVTLDLDASAVKDFDLPRLISLFRELEFRSLIPRVQQLRPGELAPTTRLTARTTTEQLSMFAEEGTETDESSTPATDQQDTARRQTEVTVVDNQEALEQLIERLIAAGTFALDIRADGPTGFDSELVGIGLAVEEGKAFYVPVGHTSGSQLEREVALDQLKRVFQDSSIGKYGHNLKPASLILARYGIELRGLELDTMLASYLENSSSRMLALDSLAAQRLGIEIMTLENLAGKGKNQIPQSDLPIQDLATYSGLVAEVTLQLGPLLRERLKHRNLLDLLDKIEMPLIGVLADMEGSGVALDTQLLQEMSGEMASTLEQIETRIYDLAGQRFNISSPPQLGDILFNQLKLKKSRRTKTGYSTDNEVLDKLRDQHPIIADVLEYRQLIKLKSTYIDALPAMLSPRDGKLHTDFNQAVAATGRLSSSNPNLQNIPIRTEIGYRIRKAFIPSEQDWVLLAADYSQIELRVLAHLSKDPRLIEAFLQGQDIHVVSAAAVWGINPSEVTSEQRRIAKVVNFGIVYGIGEQRLAYETGLSREEAGAFIADYRKLYSGVTEYMEGVKAQAQLYGQVLTLLNRVRSIPEIHSNHPGVRQAAERQAINMPVQGTAADIIKIAMVDIWREIKRRDLRSRMLLQVHDELVFEAPKEEIDELSVLVRERMMGALDLVVPLAVELHVGCSWGDLATVEDNVPTEGLLPA